ncbi:MAG: glycoside hydrolase family 15 protein [Gaiellaceae bacterium]
MSDWAASIGDYGLVGDTRTAALVGPQGSVDWLCLPHFDGVPVFGRLVAGGRGGRFALSPVDPVARTARRYVPGTTVLETRWLVGVGELVLTEGMVSDVVGSLFPTMCMVRRLEAIGGPVRVELVVDPRFGDDRVLGTFRREGLGAVWERDGLALAVSCDPALPIVPSEPIEVVVEPGCPMTVALVGAFRGPLTLVDPRDAWGALLTDAERWRGWSASIAYDGRRRDVVERSLITLRLLTYSPSGAPVAAPTTSLPEWPGGTRNWDYRYAWPRDASIGVGAFLAVGLVEEAEAFLYWLLHASRLDRPRLPALLTIHGLRVPVERTVNDWPGFASSRPVRFGNGARDQHQLDNYGWVLDAMWLLVRAGQRLDGETWRAARGLTDEVARRWREPDSGVWEVRGEPAHYVHSKLMAWLALDRALRIAQVQGVSAKRRDRWERERDAIAADVVARGFDASRRTFVRAYGRVDLDAATLLLPTIGLEPSDSPRVRGTISAIRRELAAGGPLLYRYRPGEDGLDGEEGAFLPCSFWLVQALAASGAVAAATELFDELTSLGGPLGLFAEEAEPGTGRMLGNYPQALTHASLVQAALAIRDAQDGLSSRPSAVP